MASIVFASSPLRTNSKYPRCSWILNSSSKASCCVQHLSYKNISLDSSKSSYIQGDGFSAFSLQKFSRVATEKPPSLNTITSQQHGLDAGKDIYRFTAKRDGKVVPLIDYKGKFLLIVNIPEQGSQWTKSEYEKLHRLYEEYKHKKPGFEILGFLYDKKETGEHGYGGGSQEIKKAQFPLFDRVQLNDQHKIFFGWRIDKEKREKDLWYFLKHAAPGGGDDVKEEFEKFLVDWQGIPLKRYPRFPEIKTSEGAQPGGKPSNIPGWEDPGYPLENDIRRCFS